MVYQQKSHCAFCLIQFFNYQLLKLLTLTLFFVGLLFHEIHENIQSILRISIHSLRKGYLRLKCGIVKSTDKIQQKTKSDEWMTCLHTL